MKDVSALLDLIAVVEQDPLVIKVEFLTDGDEDEFAPSLKTLIEHIETYGYGREDARALEAKGYDWIKGDCLCFQTAKGIVNTGFDNF
ncbi:hypothetical protein D3C76_25480 [compost metagenome]